jgi:hypothetical protein
MNEKMRGKSRGATAVLWSKKMDGSDELNQWIAIRGQEVQCHEGQCHEGVKVTCEGKLFSFKLLKRRRCCQGTMDQTIYVDVAQRRWQWWLDRF